MTSIIELLNSINNNLWWIWLELNIISSCILGISVYLALQKIGEIYIFNKLFKHK